MDISNEICNCECHAPGSTVRHMMACCTQCKTCGQNIKVEKFREHDGHCRLDGCGHQDKAGNFNE